MNTFDPKLFEAASGEIDFEGSLFEAFLSKPGSVTVDGLVAFYGTHCRLKLPSGTYKINVPKDTSVRKSTSTAIDPRGIVFTALNRPSESYSREMAKARSDEAALRRQKAAELQKERERLEAAALEKQNAEAASAEAAELEASENARIEAAKKELAHKKLMEKLASENQ